VHTALPPALQNLIERSTAIVLVKGELLLQPGLPVDRLWMIERGLLRRYSLGEDGSEFTHDFVGPGRWVCGALQMSEGSVCCARTSLAIEALQVSTVRALRLSELNSLSQRDAASAAYLFQQSLQHGSDRLEREAGLAHASAESRYLGLLAAQPGIESTLSQKQIAAWLGITPVALSRIRRRRAAG